MTTASTSPPGLGAGLYVHFPFCLRKCRYCNFNSGPAPSWHQEQYLTALTREIARAAPLYSDLRFATIYFGGGTPTLYPPETLVALLELLRSSFAVAKDAEITVEANPDSVSPLDLEYLRAGGFNRLSLGVQSLRDEDLRFLGRTHDSVAALRAYRAARAVGWTNINIDLLRGLPGHTPQTWQLLLEQVLGLKPDHISCYGLTLEPGTRLHAQHARGEFVMPSEETQLELYRLTDDRLSAHGYQHYEVSNWAQPGYQCRHNLNYWHNGCYVGLGAGAWSYVGGRRWGNVRDPREYVRRVLAGAPVQEETEQLTGWARIAEQTILALRLVFGVPWLELARGLSAAEAEALRRVLQELAFDGLVCLNNGYVAPTPRGLLLLNEIGVRLLAAAE
jgi:oxygen-independent coproporphyrinogen-3 oxidase